jgi:tRNA 5-methylaminomethyl-2-thiouridine biosynthesis bifunctional protein
MNAARLVGQYNARMTTITPAKVLFEGGVLRAPAFDDVYHSADGGIAQSASVFLSGNALPERWLNRSDFQILETGFGIGLNFLVTWNAWRNTVQNPEARLHFVSFEKFPLTRNDLAQVLSPYTTLTALSEDLLAAWPPLVSGFHQLRFEKGRVTLTLILGDIQETLPQLAMAADALFLDGFAPDKNPQMWDDWVIRHAARQMVYQGTLATWCVAGAVRRRLEAHGFTVQRRPGFGRKRERLEARFDKIPEEAFRRMMTTARNPVLARTHHRPITQHRAMIVGAGVAGCLMAERLTQRGWQIDLFDRHTGPAGEASGNPAGILRPVLSRDDNLASRLSRAAFFQTLHTLHRLQNETGAIRFKQNGVLVLAQDEEQATIQRSVIAHHGHPQDYVRFLEPAEVLALSGIAAQWGGWHFPQGGWLDPGSLCTAALQAGTSRIRSHWNTDVSRIEKAEAWRVFDARGQILAEAPILILALGAHAQSLPQTAELPITLFRGQITQVAHDPFPPKTPVLCQEGYVIPGLAGGLCVGATYDSDQEADPRHASTLENLERLHRLSPGWSPDPLTTVDRVGFRSVCRDRMPLVGALGSQEGLYTTMGMGSRGLIWSSLAAELMAAELAGIPLPLEKDLIRAIAPARFSDSTVRPHADASSE